MIVMSHEYQGGHNQPFLAFYDAATGGWDGAGSTQVLSFVFPRVNSDILLGLLANGPVPLPHQPKLCALFPTNS